MFGDQEILIITAIIVGVLVVPRMVKPPKPAPRPALVNKTIAPGWRAAIAVSIIYPLTIAAILQPWRGDMFVFAYAGIGPVFVGWLVYWVLQGFHSRRK